MEIEAKFALPDEAAFEEIARLDSLDGYRLVPGKDSSVVDLYMDSEERALYSAGYACRRRETGSGILITVKSIGLPSGAIHRREELELSLDQYTPPEEWPPCPARDLVLGLLGGRELRPLVELAQVRKTRRLLRGETAICEMSLDRVSMGRGPSFLELEIELLPDGGEAELEAIVDSLSDRWALTPEPRPKFERALELADDARPRSLLTAEERSACAIIAIREDALGHRARALLTLDAGATSSEAGRLAQLSAGRVRYWRREFGVLRMGVFPQSVGGQDPVELLPPERSPKPGFTPDDSIREAARRTLLSQLHRMIDHEEGVRQRGDIEELHAMRVTTRRMRAAVDLLSDYLPGDMVRPYRKSLKRAGEILGAVRDLDVFMEKTRAYIESLSEERRGGLDAVLEAWRREHEASKARLVAFMGSAEYDRFKKDFKDCLGKPANFSGSKKGGKARPKPSLVRHLLPELLFASYSRVRAYENGFRADEVPIERYHQLRIESKRLRYALEFFREALGAQASPLIEATKRLQDHLGDLQDACTACDILRAFLVSGEWRRKPREASVPQNRIDPEVAAYLAARQSEIRSLIEGFPVAWSGVACADFSSRLAVAMGAL